MNQKRKFALKRAYLNSLGWILPGVAADYALKIFTTPTYYARPEWEKKLIAKGEPLQFSNGLRATSWGSGPVVLLMHGWAGRGSQLGALVEPLTTSGFRVVALDGPAHGDSGGERSNIKNFAKALINVSHELGSIFCIVAHSFGASASVLALNDGLELNCLVLIAAPSDLKRVARNFVALMRMRPRLAARFRERLLKWDMLRPEESDLALLGEKFSIPILLVHDPKDPDVDYANSVRMQKHWPNAELLTLTGVGHRKILKAPETLSAVRDFLLGASLKN